MIASFLAMTKKKNKMTKKQILIVILTFIIGFGATFYIIRTYLPKHKVEQTNNIKDTLTNSKE